MAGKPKGYDTVRNANPGYKNYKLHLNYLRIVSKNILNVFKDGKKRKYWNEFANLDSCFERVGKNKVLKCII